MDMSKDLVSMRDSFDSLVEIFSEKMQKYNTLGDKVFSPEFSNMSYEDAVSFSDLYHNASDELRAASELLAKFVFESKDHIKFE